VTNYPTSDHCDGKRFFNPSGANGVGLAGVPKYLRTPKARWPDHVPLLQQLPPARAGDQTTITMIGHSTLLWQTPVGNIITDPVFAERVGPFELIGPRRVRSPGVRRADLPPIDLILLSHNHYDHCDVASLRTIIARDHPLCITTLGNADLLRKLGAANAIELDWWQQSDAWRVPVTLIPAQHFSGRGLLDRNHSLWGGFVVELPGCRALFAGDSGYGAHFAEIGTRLGPFDLACIPIGAYDPRWFMRDIHTDPEEAVQAHLDLRSRLSVAMHWGTFQLTAEAINDPVERLARARVALGVADEAFRVLDCGQSIVLP
jgi:L-ascorbate metabolism protein UlaG (beta-lactamase superfamily)